MDPSKSSANKPSTQPSSQTPVQPVINRWQPITDIYQQQAEGKAPPIPLEPPKPAPVPTSQRDMPKSSVPLSLHIITGLIFLRALVFFIVGGELVSDPQSDFSQSLVGLSGIMVPFTITHRHPEMFVKLVGQAMLAIAILSLVVGVLWLIRWWVIRWVTMCYAGGMVLRVCIRYFAGVASGMHNGPLGSGALSAGAYSGLVMGLSSDQMTAILFFSCAVNLIIFGYLAFYPGVKEAFEKPL